MKREFKFKLLISIMFVYTILSWIYSLGTKNYEFFYYGILLFILIIMLYIYHKKLNLSLKLVMLIVFLGILHILGGSIKIGSNSLYNVHFFGIIGYDNIVHGFGSFIALVVIYSIVAPYLHPLVRIRKLRLALLLISMTMGVGTLVEIIEFSSVVYLNAAETVGDYFNNAWDLVLNLLGSIIGVIFVIKYKENKEELIKYYKKLKSFKLK